MQRYLGGGVWDTDSGAHCCERLGPNLFPVFNLTYFKMAAALEFRFARLIRAVLFEKGFAMNALQQVKGTNNSARHFGRRVSLLLFVVV